MTRGFYLPFAEQVDPAANARIQALTASLLELPLPGLSDIVPGYANLYLEYDSRQLSQRQIQAWVAHKLAEIASAPEGRQVEIPVVYDGEDLPEIARRTGLSTAQVIERHAAPTYRVFAVGFTPGFPFMGAVEPTLRLARRAVPRTRVPAHSVAMANQQTGIYPLASPGGWHLLGHSLRAVYDPRRPQPFLLEAGDRVRFIPAEGKHLDPPQALSLLPQPHSPLMQVEEPGLLDLLVDGGRSLVGRFGLAQSGPLDRYSFDRANALVGNAADTLALELTLLGPTFTLLASVVLAFAGYGMQPLLNGEALPVAQSFAVKPGDTLAFKPLANGVRGYLAVAGGLQGEVFWGSSSVDFKGLIGKPLAAGDILGLAKARSVRPGFALEHRLLERYIRLLPGPQFSPQALRALTTTTFTVISGDRMGLRLGGGLVPGGEVLSEATPLGAVQVPPSGEPLVLLNDRGRLGGYAKPATVHPADLWKIAQTRPGESIRFIQG
ncbi:MAG: 5-oxoprolinase subunit PxpB [Thermaceae bacterium]|nr:5-oxoprolinase subunit PxpB [Thermaceae bacterium]